MLPSYKPLPDRTGVGKRKTGKIQKREMGSHILKRKIVCEERGEKAPVCIPIYLLSQKKNKNKRGGEGARGGDGRISVRFKAYLPPYSMDDRMWH